ncbi:hypothetical protein QUB68_26225 [Microcoleus sp. A006_D1]
MPLPVDKLNNLNLCFMIIVSQILATISAADRTLIIAEFPAIEV